MLFPATQIFKNSFSMAARKVSPYSCSSSCRRKSSRSERARVNSYTTASKAASPTCSFKPSQQGLLPAASPAGKRFPGPPYLPQILLCLSRVRVQTGKGHQDSVTRMRSNSAASGVNRAGLGLRVTHDFGVPHYRSRLWEWWM